MSSVWTVNTWGLGTGSKSPASSFVDVGGDGRNWQYIQADTCYFCGSQSVRMHYCSGCKQHYAICDRQPCRNLTVAVCEDCRGVD